MRRDKLEGQKYQRWTVLSHSHQVGSHQYYLCRCECGTEKIVQANSLRTGTTKSCGCHRVETSKRLHTTHGATKHPAYQSWSAMRGRCKDPKNTRYELYGGRGISVCDAWQTFEGFWADMGPTWKAGLSIDRIDVNGNYEPSNCRWATVDEQANNKRNSKFLDTPWGRMTQSQAAERAGISVSALAARINRKWTGNRLFWSALR